MTIVLTIVALLIAAVLLAGGAWLAAVLVTFVAQVVLLRDLARHGARHHFRVWHR